MQSILAAMQSLNAEIPRHGEHSNEYSHCRNVWLSPVSVGMQSDVRRRRIKGKQLLLILNSGNRIEDVIEEHKHAIDSEMLEMLEARIEAAR